MLGVVFFAAVAGLGYVGSLFLQRGLGYSPLRAAVTGFAPLFPRRRYGPFAPGRAIAAGQT